MSKKTFLASSLSVLTSINSTTDTHPIYAEEIKKALKQNQEVIVQEVLCQYFNPIKFVSNNLSLELKQKFLTYKVKKGQNLNHIAQIYNLDYIDLAKFNNIKDEDKIKEGQIIYIPICKKWVLLNKCYTLDVLAKKFKTDVNMLKMLNPLFKKTDRSYIGQIIAIPKIIKIPLDGTYDDFLRKEHRESNVNDLKNKEVKALKKDSNFCFKWPVNGEISSGYGYRHGHNHKGIDISSHSKKIPIYASLGGTVIKAGYSGAYGNLIIIDHGNGYVTYYAHLNRIDVEPKQYVSTGERIGIMGKTGNATGYHLHFEIRRNGRPLNPLELLSS